MQENLAMTFLVQKLPPPQTCKKSHPFWREVVSLNGSAGRMGSEQTSAKLRTSDKALTIFCLISSDNIFSIFSSSDFGLTAARNASD